MDFNEMRLCADKFFAGKGGMTVSKIYEADDMWIIFGVRNGQILIGAPGITINKATGEQGYFILPDEKNFEVLDSAKLVFEA